MKKLFIILFVWNTFAFAHFDAKLKLPDQDESSSTTSDLQVDEETPEVEEIIIAEDTQDIEAFLEELGDENEVLVYTDEDGNEYYIIEEKYAHANGAKPTVRKKKKGSKRNCIASPGGASWYGPGFHGRKTANGERFNQHDFTAAHKTIKFGSLVRVTYKDRSVIVRINDAGPYIKGRVIDLSKAAAKELGLIASGHGKVHIEIIRCGNQPAPEKVYRITAQ